MKCLVFDTETSISSGPHGPAAKDPSNDFYTIIYGDHPERVVIETKPEGFNRNLPSGFTRQLKICDILIGHNLPFDLSYIIKCPEFVDRLRASFGQGLDGLMFWDTQVAEYLMSGQRHSFASLAELQKIYLGRKIKDGRISALYKRGIGADIIIANAVRCPRLYAAYNAYSEADGVTTLQVFEKQYKKAKELNMLPVIQLYMQYMAALVVISNTGIQVDLDNCQKTQRDFKLKSCELQEAAMKIVAPYWAHKDLPSLNINSNTHKSALLFGGKIKVKVRGQNGIYKDGRIKYKFFEEFIEVEGIGVNRNLTEESKKDGCYKTGAEIVEKIYASPDVNEEVKEYCRLQKEAANLDKMCSTYLDPFQKLSINGVLFPNFNNTQTITGRLSSSKPNMQNIPSKGGMLEQIQGQLIAPPGWKTVALDYSQLEVYIQAYLSQDQAMTNDLLSNVDFHVKRLAYAEDMTYDQVHKLCKIDKLPEWTAKRIAAKTISFQKAYGAAPKSLSKSTGIPEEIIKKIFEKEDLEYPNVKIFYDWVQNDVNNTAVLSTMHMLPKAKKTGGINGKKWLGGAELLPIQNGYGNIEYDREELRHVGYYQAITGRRYSFEELGRYDRHGRLQRGYSHTQTKNYMVQGTAGDVMAAATVALMPLVLTNDNFKIVNTIHDSLWCYIRDDEQFDLTISNIKSIMENIPKLFKDSLNIHVPFKFKVDCEVGTNFANTEVYEVASIAQFLAGQEDLGEEFK